MRLRNVVVLAILPTFPATCLGSAGDAVSTDRIGAYNALEHPTWKRQFVVDELKLTEAEVQELERLEREFKRQKAELTERWMNLDLKDLERFLRANADRERKRKKLEREFDNRIAKLLRPDKLRRLAEITLQRRLANDPLAFLAHDPQIAWELRLDRQQVKRLKSLSQKWSAATSDISRVKLMHSAVSVLRTDQRTRLSKLRGKLVGFDVIGNRQNQADVFRSNFQYADQNRDGSVTKKEGVNHFWGRGADVNHDGRIDPAEAKSALVRYAKETLFYQWTVLSVFTYPKTQKVGGRK